MKKILVTGGAGFIGANFINYWLKNYDADQIVVLDALTYAGNLASLVSVKGNKNFKFVHGDICDQELVESLITNNSINLIVNFAAESHVDRSITGPDAFIQTNILGTYSLLKAAKKCWIDNSTENGQSSSKNHFHHVSTDEVYGSLLPTDPGFTEDTSFAPSSPYSASKAASDHLVSAYHHTYGLSVTISNCSNNYGPYHFPEKLVPLVITNVLLNKSLPIYGDGMQIRDWLYVEDHSYGIDLVLNYGRVGQNYNIGGNNEWANINIVKAVCNVIEKQFVDRPELKDRFPEAIEAINQNSESLISYVTDRAGHDRRYAIDATKIRDELGYEPRESFETGIAKTVDWYLKNEVWWKAVIDGSYQD